jgi:hypothetical protein
MFANKAGFGGSALEMAPAGQEAFAVLADAEKGDAQHV